MIARHGLGARILAVLISIVFVVSLVPIPQSFAEGTDAQGSAAETTQSAPESEESEVSEGQAIFPYAASPTDPKFEQGKINVTGNVTLASDMQLVQDLRWSFPFENPLRPGEGIADPGRPYKYVIWQSKKSTSQTNWSNWETRSGVDVDDPSNKVRVLNVYPSPAAESYLRTWMNQQTVDPNTGQTVPVSRNILDVKTVHIDDFNRNPNAYLMQDVEGTNIKEYKYDVLMFGTYDWNAHKDLSAASRDAVVAFSRAGGGLMFGHDTMTGNKDGELGNRPHIYFNRFAQPDFLNLNLAADSKHSASYCKVTDTGFLTSRPWNLEGATLSIPTTHVYGQRVPKGSPTRIWMQMSDNRGNIMTTPGLTSDRTDNFYLITNGANAMIQTGHSNGHATIDESKVFANTLLYIAQGSTYTKGKDLSFADEDKPSDPNASLTNVNLTEDGWKYSATVEIGGSTDYGTEFAYKIQGIPQASIEGDSAYTTIWSTPGSGDMGGAPAGTSIVQTALSGLRGYYVSGVNTNANPVALNKGQVNASKVIPASNANDKVEFTTDQNLALNTQYYAHVYAVDWAGNVSQDIVVPIAVTERTARFHLNYDFASTNDTEDVVAQSLFTNNDILASYPADPTREGYRFDGWYTTPACDTELIERTGHYSEAQYTRHPHFFAKWVKTYEVDVSQRGDGVTRLAPVGAEPVPVENQVHVFDVDTDLEVTFEPAEGNRIKSVWLDDNMLEPSEYDGNRLSIPKLAADHHVVVEYVKQDDSANKAYSTVSTNVTGDSGSTTITKTSVVENGTKDAQNYVVKWNVAPDHEVTMIYVDGIARPDLLAKGATQVTFPKVEDDHYVEVAVMPKSGADNGAWNVQTVLNGGPGSITPTMKVPEGEAHVVKAAVFPEHDANYELKAENIVVKDAQGNTLTPAQLTAAGISIRAAEDGGFDVEIPDVETGYQVVATITPKQQSGVVTVPTNELMKINTSKEGSGDISESRIVRVGDEYVVTWKAAEGWSLKSVVVDGKRSYYPAQAEEGQIAVKMLTADGLQGIDQQGNVTTLEEGEEQPGDETTEIPTETDKPIVIASEGSYPFTNIQQTHDIHVVFAKDTVINTDPDSEEAKNSPTHRVVTNLLSEGLGSITASANNLPKGSDYPVSWEVPAGHTVHRVLVDGVNRPELVKAGKVDLNDINSDHSVTVIVEHTRTGANGIQVKLDRDSLTRFLYEDVTPGTPTLSNLASHNSDEATAWAKQQATEKGLKFLGWTDNPDDTVLVNPNDKLGGGYTTLYPVFGSDPQKGKPSNGDKPKPGTPDDPNDPDGPNGPNDPNDPNDPDGPGTDPGNKPGDEPGGDDPGDEPGSGDDPTNPDNPGTDPGDEPGDEPGEPVDPADPGTTPEDDPTIDVTPEGYVFINKVLRNLDHPTGPNRVGDTVRYYISAQNNRLTGWTDVTLRDTLPDGLEVKADSVCLIKRQLSNLSAGTTERLGANAYTLDGNTITYKAGTIEPGLSYVLAFDVVLTRATMDADNAGKQVKNSASVLGRTDGTLVPGTPTPPQDPDNPGEDPGTDPGDTPGGDDPSGTDPETIPPGPIGGLTEELVIPDDGTVHWNEPVIELQKTAKNLTNPKASVTKVNDRIAYEVTMTTTNADSCIDNGLVFDKLPDGVKPDTATLKLTDKQGAVSDLPASVYNAETNTVAVQVGMLMNGESVKLSFEAVVTEDAAGSKIPNVAYGTDLGPKVDEEGNDGPGYTGELPEGSVPSNEAYPSSGDENSEGVVYADAQLKVTKTAENLTHKDSWHVGDTVAYTIMVENTVGGSKCFRTTLEDVMSKALVLDTASLELTLPDGQKRTLEADKVFDASLNRINVDLGEIPGNGTCTLTYKTTLQEPDILTQVKNDVSVSGFNHDGNAAQGGSDGFVHDGKVTSDATGSGSNTDPDINAEANATIPYPEDGSLGKAGQLLAKTADESGMLIAGAAAVALAAALACLLKRRKAGEQRR